MDEHMKKIKKWSLALQNLATGAAIVGSYFLVSGNILTYHLTKDKLKQYTIADVRKQHEGTLEFMVGNDGNPKGEAIYIRSCLNSSDHISKKYEVAYAYCKDRYNGIQAVHRIARDAWVEDLQCVPKIRDEPFVRIIECEDGSRLEKRNFLDVISSLIGEIGYRYAIQEAVENEQMRRKEGT